MLNKEKNVYPDIEGEMDEFQRLSQDLKRDEDVDISVDEIVSSFKNSEEQTLTDDIWNKLENTESNEIEKGDIEAVNKIAKMYNKTNPNKLIKVIRSGEYKRPLILNLEDRYILVAGNTRLCTAAAMGMNPKVFIAKINTDMELDEKWSDKYKGSIDCNNPKGFSQKAHCQGKNKKRDTKESMGADSAGPFSALTFGNVILKKDLYKQHNTKKYNVNEEEEFTEVTSAFSSGAYDAPFGSGSKNPLKIGGEKSIKNSRAVKDKNFPKWGGPKSVFIKIKDKCKRFPYCNQGDINTIELLEKNVEINETNKIFINMNISDLNKIIEETATSEIRDMIISESKKEKTQVYHIKLDGEPIETFQSKTDAEEALPKYQDKNKGELIIEPEMYESYDDMIEKMDKMGEELEEKENKNMKNQEAMEGNSFIKAMLDSKKRGDKTFTHGGEEYDVKESMSSMEEESKGKGVCNECGTMLNEEGMCSECNENMNESKSTKKKKTIRFTESEMISLLKKMVSESVPGLEVTKRAQTQSKKDNEENAKMVGEKLKKASKMEGGTNPEFPNQNNKGTKMVIHNTEEENEFVQDTRGGTMLNLDYDQEPSDKFLRRLKASLEGDSTTGNSQEASNVIKSDLGKNLAKQSERKRKKESEAPMYNKDTQPVKNVSESLSDSTTKIILKEEIYRMKNISSYNKKTQ